MKFWNDWKRRYLQSFFYTFLRFYMDDITDLDLRQVKRVFKNFEIRILHEYYDLYVEGDTLVLADVCENFWNVYLETYEFDPACFLTEPRLAWLVTFHTELKLDSLTVGRK